MHLELISAIPNPQRTCAIAARSCYDEKNAKKYFEKMNEVECADWLFDACLQKQHYSPLEHASFTILTTNAPHSMVVQIRTHRIINFQVQSMRYTGSRMLDETIPTKDLFYFLPEGVERSTTRDGRAVVENQADVLMMFESTRQNYIDLVNRGVPKERARDVLGSGYVQNFVMTANLRAIMHLFSMRTPKDAQLECQLFCEDLYQLLIKEDWATDLLKWYRTKYWGKSKLAF